MILTHELMATDREKPMIEVIKAMVVFDCRNESGEIDIIVSIKVPQSTR